MPLRRIEEYRSWVEREAPSATAQRAARHFLVELSDRPWRAPSVPIAELSDQPDYEVRYAALEVAGEQPVRIWYRHIYANDAVDMIAITNQ